MARPNQFDQEIKSKVYSHQAEPSARVWAGVREAIPARTPSRKIIFLRFSAALILLSLAGGAWWYFGTDNGPAHGGEQLTQEFYQTDPAPQSDWAGSTSNESTSDASPVAVETAEDNTQDSIREEATAWNAPTAKASTTAPSRKAFANNDNNNSNQPAQENTSEPVADPELEARLDVSEEPELVVPVEIVTATPPLVPTLQEAIAEEEQQVKEGTVEEVKEVEGEAAQSRKRLIDFSNLQDVKAQTGSAITNLAQEAGEKIGIHTEREQTDKKKKFSANFRSLKIKRVKNK